ncbi:MAG TPA: hypothetical protein VFE40_08685 [Jatrophihabitantaceae bacterium]|jgi:hypothetical protein|nr:hypothetical protein [Jatrophihabitantaceae bacterium]
MTLLIVALCGLIALAGILCLLEFTWRRAAAVRFVPPDALLGSVEDVEREVTADLLAGRVTAEHYRSVVAALADESDALLNRQGR